MALVNSGLTQSCGDEGSFRRRGPERAFRLVTVVNCERFGVPGDEEILPGGESARREGGLVVVKVTADEVQACR